MPNPFRTIGPGIIMAATGLGAGDLITASVAGARYGEALLWAVVLGAVLKFAMNEGLARWQLATGTTLLEGWVLHLPRAVSIYFFLYLILWTFVVSGALIAACGLAAHAMFPALSLEWWGILHSLAAVALVLTGRYQRFESIMKFFIVMMSAVVIVSAMLSAPDAAAIISGIFNPSIPDGSLLFVFGIMGGVGGSVTLLSYGYWMREKGWRKPEDMRRSRIDLAAAYVLTALFGMAILVVSAGINPEVVAGNQMALAVADHMGTIVGPAGRWSFLVGFWGAVFSSMLGVWHGVPYLFTDFVQMSRRGRSNDTLPPPDRSSWLYKGYLAAMAVLPMSLLALGKPVWIILLYAVAGAMFMPLLAGLLLYMNNQKKWLGSFRNGLATNFVLSASLLIFGTLLAREILPGIK